MGGKKQIVIVFSPLELEWRTKIKKAARIDLTAMQLGVHSVRNILNGQCLLVFGTSEAWLLNDKWRNMLTFPEKLGIEMHCGRSLHDRQMISTMGELNSSD